ncbi:Unknown protein [Striga hermonthica]|uniref:Uncharacterized protein n=1 Tax=Striga hermonthica TaxID=68872 RepID=A0A9N7MKD9_STRHE|nr:Unknown protein [Striga hermonthica]
MIGPRGGQEQKSIGPSPHEQKSTGPSLLTTDSEQIFDRAFTLDDGTRPRRNLLDSQQNTPGLPTMPLPAVIQRAVRGVLSYFHREWELQTHLDIINGGQLTPEVRHHLQQVYGNVCSILLCLGLGFDMSLGFHMSLNWFIGSGFLELVRIARFAGRAPFRQVMKFGLVMAGIVVGVAIVAPWVSMFLAIELCWALYALSWATFRVLGSSETTQIYLFRFCKLLLSHPLLVVCAFVLTFGSQLEVCLWIVLFVGYVAVYSLTLVHMIQEGRVNHLDYAITFFTDAPAICLRMINLMFRGAWSGLQEIMNYLRS